MSDLHQQIADLEIEIEALSDEAERARKTILVAKVATAAGGLMLMLVVVELFRFEPLVLVAGIAASLGGIAAYGTNKSTLDEVTATIQSHEVRRTEMINELELRTLGPGGRQ